MDMFLATSLAFPTLAYSIALGVAILLWGVVALGMLDLDGIGLDDGAGVDAGGMLGRMGLDGLPWLVVFTLVAFVGWILTYFVHLVFLAPLPQTLRWLVGAVVAVVAAVPSILIASAVLRPLRRLLLKLRRPPPVESLLGKVAAVRTQGVDLRQGMADLDDGGAGLVLQVRSDAEGILRGERVVLVGYEPAGNTWRVVRERDYTAF